MKHLFTLKSLLLTLVMLCGLNAWGATTLFHETFGDNSDKARVWDDSYSVKSGIEAVYSSVTGYTITNAKQSKASGDYQSALIQTTKNQNASIVIGPLNAAACSEMVLTYKWNAGSTKGNYSTSASYATSVDGKYTALTGSGKGATSFVERKYTLPVEAQVSTLYLKIVWNTSNTQGYIDEVDLSGVYAESGYVAPPVITVTPTPNQDGKYYLNTVVTATIKSATEGAKIQYAITRNDVTDATAIKTWEEGSEVSFTSSEPATMVLWAKAVMGDNVSDAVKKEFTFINPPKQLTFTKVTDASQLVAGAKYAIINATTTKIVSGYDGSTYTSTTPSETNGIVKAMDNQVIVFTLGGNGDNSWTLYDNTKGKFVGGNSEIDFKFGDDASALKKWTIAFVDTKGSVKIYYGTRGFNFSSKGAVKNYATSNYGNSDYTYPTLWQMVEGTTVGLKEVLDGNVGGKYQINCALRVNYKDANYAYASTTENNSSKKNTANEVDKGKGWSDKEADFTQNDWVAIQNSDLELGDQVAIGSVATLVSNGAFPVIEFVSMSKDAPETPFKANKFRVANFNIGKDVNAVKYVWLVAPQAGEFCHVRGYVAAAEGGKVTLKSAQESSTVTIGVTPITVDPVEMTVNYTGAVTTGNWFSFTGIVVNGTNGLELNAISAEDVSTGVEGVEASSVKVYGAEGVINVVSEEVAPIAVYSANGAIVSSVEASSASIAVAPGFYIVKAGNSVSKVTVK